MQGVLSERLFGCPQDCLSLRSYTGPLKNVVKMKYRWGGHFKKILYENADKNKKVTWRRNNKKPPIYQIKSFAGLPNLARLSLYKQCCGAATFSWAAPDTASWGSSGSKQKERRRLRLRLQTLKFVL